MGEDDDLRPLTPYGKERMALEAENIRRLHLGLDVILTSPLMRAQQTAEIVAYALDSEDLLHIDERISPGFGPGDLQEIVEEYDQADAIMLVGHEPDFSLLIEHLIGGGTVVCKKGSLARVDLSDAGPLAGELVWLIPPKVLALES